MLPKLERATDRIISMATDWAEWCSKDGAGALTQCAADTADALVPDLPADWVSLDFLNGFLLGWKKSFEKINTQMACEVVVISLFL